MNDELARTGAPPTGTGAGGSPVAPVPAGSERSERRGCLFALSQPPLMLFLTVVGSLLLFAAIHDLYRL
ncbi:hypothetical protein [Streptomyces sp. TP-A0874]|uniref:hypothetical protein n=1 Tax=Streptomyces sp. TP-A0874 TaxID=549819 RepID=UPI00085391F6|nr:hypothetical protein [Streptomyces sp. TP-A0874]